MPQNVHNCGNDYLLEKRKWEIPLNWQKETILFILQSTCLAVSPRN